ncbi:MAG: glycosyltransferase family 39 protein [Solirubrobacteraceae bacterium]|nr:glycosyltransferase family 39 protein [Solirubrobacteraceae bacterium]
MRPSGYAVALLLLLAGAFVLRIWGAGQGLPYAYNADENAHFVPHAIGMFVNNGNPEYYVNPSGYTNVLYLVFSVWFGGRKGVSDMYAMHPSEVFIVARVTAAALGTLAVGLIYMAGARLFDRRTGLLAAALLAVSFLPVFYSHLALNDVPTLAPIALSLYGTAGVLREGRVRDYVIAGLGLGLAAATKYTGGIVILPLFAATIAQFTAPGGHKPAVRGLVLAGLFGVIGFAVANPYALIDFSAFREGLAHQTTAADDSLGKLGLTQDNGVAYYLWTFTWGLGWVPLIAGVGGALLLLRDELRLSLVLAPAPILFVLFMGSQARFFGRWLIPVFPMVVLLAAYCVIELSDTIGRRSPRLRLTALVVGVLALCGQGLVYSLHSGLVLSRGDTRNLTRAWMVAHIPEGTRIVVEPIVPDGWASDIGHPFAGTSNGYRWKKFPTSRATFNPDTGAPVPPPGVVVNIEDYERILRPSLINDYEAGGYCWVVTGSTQRGRAEAEPDVVPQAVAYYRELDRRGEVVYQSSPYDKGASPVKFNFDWSFEFYPLAYRRPGPLITIYRLRGGACAGVS